MGSSQIPAAAGKTRFALSLISGTSWTVPAGVTYVNVTLFGGGGGGCGSVGVSTGGGNGGTGGTTTFTGATSATGGLGANATARLGYAGFTSTAAGIAGSANTGNGGSNAMGIEYTSASNTFSGNWSTTGGQSGQIVSSTLATTPSASITYAIGGGGSAGTAGTGGSGQAGGAGGSGRIDIEYWV